MESRCNFAKAGGKEEEVFAVFRRTHNEIAKVFGACAAGINLGVLGSIIAVGESIS
jgi:hypothetical protein